MLYTQWNEAAQFRPPSRTTLSHAIVDQLRRRIVRGELRPHERLPSIRKLARLHRVSVPTMQAAIEGLRTLGLVRVVPGVGMWVASPRHDTGLMGHAWRSATPHELAGLRRRMDAWAAPTLTGHVAGAWPGQRPPRTLGDLNFLVHERSMRRSGYAERFLRTDVTFHRTVLATIPGMEVMPTLYEQIATALLPSLMAVAGRQASEEELDAWHLQLAAAILDGAGERTVELADAIAHREAILDE